MAAGGVESQITAVHGKKHTSNGRCRTGGQEDDRPHHVIRFKQSIDGKAGQPARSELAGVESRIVYDGLQGWCAYLCWQDSVDANTPAGELHGQFARQLIDSAFAGAVRKSAPA